MRGERRRRAATSFVRGCGGARRRRPRRGRALRRWLGIGARRRRASASECVRGGYQSFLSLVVDLLVVIIIPEKH